VLFHGFVPPPNPAINPDAAAPRRLSYSLGDRKKMNIVEAIIYAIGEAASYMVGALIGRTYRLEPKRAQRIGQTVIIVLFAGALIAFTVIYS